MHTIANVWAWIAFSLLIIIALIFDSVVLRNKTRPHHSIRTALYWSLAWFGVAIIFNMGLWLILYFNLGLKEANENALLFFTGYLIEKSLSIDNLFTFYLIFSHFRIPLAHQQFVFSIGIWSAIVLRLLFIAAGAYLVSQFHWLLYIMGVFLLLTGFKMCFTSGKNKDLAETLTIKLMNKIMRTTHELHQHRFFIRKNKLLYATPLFLALIFVELSDIVFAMDSIPAIFAITTDPFLVWSSNIFAILGLRALYFLLAKLADQFALLKYGVACILMFVGFKMLIEPWFHIPVGVSLAVIIFTLLIFAWLSVKNAPQKAS